MKFTNFLIVENYNDYKRKWNKIDKDFVDSLIEKFKKYNKLGEIKAPENDIGYWVKKHPSELFDFLSKIKSSYDYKQDMKDKEKSSKIFENDKILIVKPLNRSSMCKYGANTKWCLTSKNDDIFSGINKFNYIGVVIFKDINKKYAITILRKNNDIYNIWDEEDKQLNSASKILEPFRWEQFLERLKEAKLKFEDVLKMIIGKKLTEAIEQGERPNISSEGIDMFVVAVNNVAENERLQKWAFANGLSWNNGEKKIKFNTPRVKGLTINLKNKDYIHYTTDLSYHRKPSAEENWGKVYSLKDFMEMMEYDNRIKVKPSQVK